MENQASSEKPGRIKRLLDKYRSLALVTALLISTIGASAQIQSGALQYINAKGYVWKQAAADSSLRTPLDTFHLRTSDKSSIVVLWTSDTSFRTAAWNGFKWILSCDCSGGTTPAPAFAITTQPVSQTVAEGAPFSFTVAAANGTTPYTYNWFKNGSALGINNATISSSSAASDSDADYYATVTDATSTTLTSNTVHLTVTIPTTITFGYSATDPYVDNSTAPTISNSATQSISSGANISHSYPAAAVDKFLVIKIPVGQPTPTIWYSTSFNNGTIPDATFRAVFTVGSFKYLVSRDGAGVAFDYTVPFQFNH